MQISNPSAANDAGHVAPSKARQVPAPESHIEGEPKPAEPSTNVLKEDVHTLGDRGYSAGSASEHQARAPAADNNNESVSAEIAKLRAEFYKEQKELVMMMKQQRENMSLVQQPQPPLQRPLQQGNQTDFAESEAASKIEAESQADLSRPAAHEVSPLSQQPEEKRVEVFHANSAQPRESALERERADQQSFNALSAPAATAGTLQSAPGQGDKAEDLSYAGCNQFQPAATEITTQASNAAPAATAAPAAAPVQAFTEHPPVQMGAHLKPAYPMDIGQPTSAIPRYELNVRRHPIPLQPSRRSVAWSSDISSSYDSSDP